MVVLEQGRWQRFTLGLNGTPPSLNKAGSRGRGFGGANPFHREKKTWQAAIEKMLLVEGMPRRLADKVLVTAVLRFPDRRRRDEGNYRSLLEKACGDALTNGAWLPDDTPDHYRFLELSFAAERGPAETWLLIAWRCGLPR